MSHRPLNLSFNIHAVISATARSFSSCCLRSLSSAVLDEKTYSTSACVHLLQQCHLHLGWVHCTLAWLLPTFITSHKPYWTCCFALSLSRHLWDQSDSDSCLTSTDILSSEFMWPLVHHWCHGNFTTLHSEWVVIYPSCTCLSSPLKLLLQAAW